MTVFIVSWSYYWKLTEVFGYGYGSCHPILLSQVWPPSSNGHIPNFHHGFRATGSAWQLEASVNGTQLLRERPNDQQRAPTFLKDVIEYRSKLGCFKFKYIGSKWFQLIMITMTKSVVFAGLLTYGPMPHLSPSFLECIPFLQLHIHHVYQTANHPGFEPSLAILQRSSRVFARAFCRMRSTPANSTIGFHHPSPNRDHTRKEGVGRWDHEQKGPKQY